MDFFPTAESRRNLARSEFVPATIANRKMHEPMDIHVIHGLTQQEIGYRHKRAQAID